jgi:hypothetical protein
MNKAWSDGGKEGRLITEIADQMEKLSSWEVRFIESVSDQLDRNRELTEKQRSTISRIYQEKILGW